MGKKLTTFGLSDLHPIPFYHWIIFSVFNNMIDITFLSLEICIFITLLKSIAPCRN